MFATSIALLLTAKLVEAALDVALFGERNVSQFADGHDLARYMSRPDLRPPILSVTQYDPAAVSPGYWFVSPYGVITPAAVKWDYQPFEGGPMIYDNAGNLIWSGAPMLQHRHAFDFKATRWNDSDHLTFALGTSPITEVPAGPDDQQLGVITDFTYEIQDKVDVNSNRTIFDIHEFNIIDDGKIALMTTTKVQLRNVSEVGVAGLKEKRVANKGFQEIEVATRNVNFEWDALENGVSLTESYHMAALEDRSRPYWDFFHINAVDKTRDGDYLISARHTNTIYKVSGINGSIMWRLGGKRSDFLLLDGLNFSSQHDVRIRSENNTVSLITIFDNASDDDDDDDRQPPSSRCSSGKLLALYTTTSPMTAKLIQQWDRPDGLLTAKRGNTQVLPNGNVVLNWGDRGYLSEFTADGRHLVDAEYISSRFGSYRAYKFNFTGSPIEPPALKTYAYGSGTAADDMVTVFYISWNGATEVATWNFYGSQDATAGLSMIGSAKKSGFETSYMSPRYIKYTYAEAVSADGKSLGRSEVQETILPNGLDEVPPDGMEEDDTDTQPDDTALPPDKSSLGPIAFIFIAVVLAFAFLGMAATAYFLWNRKTLLSRGVYAPVSSSDNFDSSELSVLAYDDQEVEK